MEPRESHESRQVDAPWWITEYYAIVALVQAMWLFGGMCVLGVVVYYALPIILYENDLSIKQAIILTITSALSLIGINISSTAIDFLERLRAIFVVVLLVVSPLSVYFFMYLKIEPLLRDLRNVAGRLYYRFFPDELKALLSEDLPPGTSIHDIEWTADGFRVHYRSGAAGNKDSSQ